jgi:hypothetical protein
MLKLLCLLFAFAIIETAHADKCSVCTTNTTSNCAQLSYFMKNCANCARKNRQCSNAFCKNHPNNCHDNEPLKNLSINTMDVTDNGVVLDVCMAKLFAPMQFEEMNNNDLNIMSLNLLDITSFSQTGGQALKRNLGILRKLAAKYFVYTSQQLGVPINNLKLLVDQWFIANFHKDPDYPQQFTTKDFHIIAEELRREIYKLKGIDTQLRTETFNRQKFPMTVSKLGCKGETGTD